MSRPKSKWSHSSGQIAIEYVLILFLSVFIAVILTKGLVSRNPEEPGLIIQSWAQILQTIGKDMPD